MKKTTFIFLFVICALSLTAQHTIEIKHKYYTMEFDTVQSAEILGFYVQTTAHSTATPKMPRTGKFARFTPDPMLKGEVLANDNEYTSWNHDHPDDLMDRGHINPFTAFDFAEDAALESMYFSNTCPQAKYFNEHQWEALEQHVLKLSRGDQGAAPIDNIKVWTGVLISVSHPKKMNDVPKPDFYWKVISYTKDGQTVQEAWLGANETSNHTTSPDAIKTDASHVKNVVLQYYPKLKLDFN
jgi:DNA/RNA endonuclease G (NUC1)